MTTIKYYKEKNAFQNIFHTQICRSHHERCLRVRFLKTQSLLCPVCVFVLLQKQSMSLIHVAARNAAWAKKDSGDEPPKTVLKIVDDMANCGESW